MTLENPNPYAAPGAEIQPGPEPRGSAFKAVAIGLLVDVGTSLICSLIVGVLYGIWMVKSGASPEQVGGFAKGMQNNPAIAIATYCLGTCSSILGGYVCARIAKHSEYKLGSILAVLSISVGILMSASTYTLVMGIVTAFVTLAAILFGTWIGARKNAG